MNLAPSRPADRARRPRTSKHPRALSIALRRIALAWLAALAPMAALPCVVLGQAEPPEARRGHAEGAEGGEEGSEEGSGAAGPPARRKKVEGIGLPGAYYRPDTSLGFGAFAQLTFRANPWARETESSRPSSVSVSGAYTLRHQYQAKARAQIFLNQDDLILTLAAEFSHFPTRLYGFGNTADASHETYVDRHGHGEFQLERRVTDQLYVGWISRIRQTWIYDEESSTYLDEIGGSKNGGLIHGLGISLRLEGRDYLHAPLEGYLATFELMGNFPRLGSEQRFVSVRAEGRKYFHLGREHVLAFRGLAWLSFGQVPFYETTPLGRAFTMRGYFEGRYRDDHYVAAQAEYRFPLFWRIYGATFVDAGTVFGPHGRFAFSRLQISGGGGLRIRVSDKDRVMLRVDAAVGRGTHGVVVGVNEAF